MSLDSACMSRKNVVVDMVKAPTPSSFSSPPSLLTVASTFRLEILGTVHTHTHSHTFTYTHTQLTLTHNSHTLKHTHTHSYTLTHTHTLIHTLTTPDTYAPGACILRRVGKTKNINTQ